ncbi:MAG: ATP-binding protein [Cyanobacteria bacterium P01_A01_bin.17]
MIEPISPFAQIKQKAASLLLYQAILQTGPGLAFIKLLSALEQQEVGGISTQEICLRAYCDWYYAVVKDYPGWLSYGLQQILWAENPLTLQMQAADLTQLPPALITAAQHDLRLLQQLFADPEQQLQQALEKQLGNQVPMVPWGSLGAETPFETVTDWAEALPTLAQHYRRYGTGLFAQYRAFQWRGQQLVGLTEPDAVSMTQLVGYETQRDRLVQNTEALLAGKPALNVLLYGSRGSGKSALIKSLLTEYGDRNLRLIELGKSDLSSLPQILHQIRSRPQKFIIFVDDLSFEADEGLYKALKVVLEGNLTARPTNVVVYATSNRRHLIREFFGDRPRPSDADEIHNWDTVQEKLSLCDRFGLTLTFEPADQETYLQIVHHLALQAGLNLASDDLDFRALQWATRQNGRSGRTARQFVDFLQTIDLS